MARFVPEVREMVAAGKTLAFADAGDPTIYCPWSWVLERFADLSPAIVPGLSSFNAGNAALRRSITRHSGSILLTAGDNLGAPDANGRLKTTLVIFTQRAKLQDVLPRLAARYPADTPIAVVCEASYVSEKVVTGTLNTILKKLGDTKLPHLYLIYAGDGLLPEGVTSKSPPNQLPYRSKVPQGVIPVGTTGYPFSFLYDGKPSNVILDTWKITRTAPTTQPDGSEVSATRWTEPKSGLSVTWQFKRFPQESAADWVLYFENTGKTDTAIVENVQALDLKVEKPRLDGVPYLLHKTHGGSADPVQFEPSVVAVDGTHRQTLDAGHGRSSAKDFPFFKIETGQGSIIVAVGWSGFWKALLECPDNKHLHLAAGLDKTRFLLHPGEKVRSPRMLVMLSQGDTLEANARFRQLLYKHYVAKRDGKTPLPIPFCNTCFTRGGGWLNECNAENQISLIQAYSKLGLEALLTDAGWFTGGWPAGTGNWDPRKDAYPRGMGPVALAAKQRGMIYGLWFEPERVVAGTTVQKKHPAWCLKSVAGPQDTFLLNFGLPEVQDYFFNIVKGFMALPGFRVYRQDFNMDPRPYWIFNDAPDRQGITEMKYIEGLYAYWDRLAAAWPDSLREECASGGNRIDLETIQRLHIAQKTDYWFNDEVDQAALWGVSQYLPNNCIVAHLNKLDEYSFHSTLASSLCLGWIADAADFDVARGKKLLGRYLEVRHLLIGAWYPLLPYSRDRSQWMAVQYHRPDLGEGMVLAFRRPESPNHSVRVALHGLAPGAVYELSYDSTGKKVQASGNDLQSEMILTLPRKRSSELIHYRRVILEK